MKKSIAFLVIIMLIPVLAGCSNTANGAGRDIENWGEWMQNTF